MGEQQLTSEVLSRAGSIFEVERSFTGKRWRAREADARAALALAQRLDVPEIVGRVLAGRGVALDDAPKFLNPTLRDMLPDPSRLRDMDKAVERLVRAINAGEKIAVFGDYDVDGATSTALLARFFAAIGREVLVYIPDRRMEGYGPNAAAMRKLRAAGARGRHHGRLRQRPPSRALEAAAEAGLDVIVIDHHMARAAPAAGLRGRQSQPARRDRRASVRSPRSASRFCFWSRSTARCAAPTGTARAMRRPI